MQSIAQSDFRSGSGDRQALRHAPRVVPVGDPLRARVDEQPHRNSERKVAGIERCGTEVGERPPRLRWTAVASARRRAQPVRGACAFRAPADRRGARAGGVHAPRRAVPPRAARADAVAIVAAFALTLALSARRCSSPGRCRSGCRSWCVCAKVTGLYDRDETLLRKTTLDEAPKLFQLATLCALVAWLAGGLVVDGTLDRREALFLWLALARAAGAGARAARGRSRCGMAPAERCLFIGDERSARDDPLASWRSRRRARRRSSRTSTSTRSRRGRRTRFSAPRLAEIRDLAQTLDVHRAIIAPRSVDASEMLEPRAHAEGGRACA